MAWWRVRACLEEVRGVPCRGGGCDGRGMLGECDDRWGMRLRVWHGG